MRTFTRLFSLFAVLLPSVILANVYVHGTVKHVNGTPVANYQVRIETDSSANNPVACQYLHSVYTNPNGFYSDTLFCSSNISRVYVSIFDCNGSYVHHDYNLTNTQTAESNFVICDSVAATCHASFTWQQSNLEIHFFSGVSAAGNPVSDSILSRTWTFGDGTSLSGNTINPVHLYNQAGTYTVCLKIKTYSGCENTYCSTLQFFYSTCTANYTWERIPGTNRIHFNSITSTTAPLDTITSRKWKFGDGDSLSGNVVSPEHTYLQPGTYNACLTTRTAMGCENTTCKIIVIQSPNITCEASFTYLFLNTTATGFPVKLNSTVSHTSPGDSIMVRHWTFGDGTTGVGVDPTHIYAQPGTYVVCLKIESYGGCSDSTCTTIHIIALPTLHCEAVYTIENVTAPPAGSNPALHYIRFNSSNSHGNTIGDSVISRTWNFGDSTPNLQGNQINPLHGYIQTGTYNACLYILTQSGCRDTVCHTIVIAPAPVNCQPHFATTATALSVVFNSSTSTSAIGDSIISRTWTFGDGTSAGNTVNVTHQYAQVGEYQTCLTIHTRLGCVSVFCKKIAVINQPGNCVPYFTKEQVTAPLRTIRFNSTAAYSQFPNDSIIERKWTFGDGQTLSGNVISPLHTYLHGGTYNVCLMIRTAHCDGHWCQSVLVRPLDSTNTVDSIQIVNLYPVPVNTQLNAVIFSSHSNIAAELAIYDVYGIRKWFQNTILPQGNSTYNIPTAQLANGPYIFRVTTMYGVKSRNFYKLN